MPDQLGLTGPVPNYGGRRFRPAGDRPDGSVGHYHQDGDLVWADFSGPHVRVGRLVGTCRPDGVIDAVYCLVTTEGETIAGACVSTPTILDDGRVQLTEQWRRLDGPSGVSHIEEVPACEADAARRDRPGAGVPQDTEVPQ